METIQVLMMLFKGVWVKTIECGTAYSCISFDPSKPGLYQMYVKNLAFDDPEISLAFGDDPTRWRLLIKDWLYHETLFAAESFTHFYLQTWGRMGLKHMHLKLPGRLKGRTADAQAVGFRTRCLSRKRLLPEKVPGSKEKKSVDRTLRTVARSTRSVPDEELIETAAVKSTIYLSNNQRRNSQKRSC
jgi:hypothetical protein